MHKAFHAYADWELDYARFRVWLTEKYKVERAYIFIGLIPKNKALYTHLSEAGFTLVFKEVVYHTGGATPKGNCDTDLMMQALEDYYESRLHKAVLVSSDGDYAPLVKKLHQSDRFEVILSPSPSSKCSILLKRTGARIAYIGEQRSILERRTG